MRISFTAKVDGKAHKALSEASKLVEIEMLELMRTCNANLPEIELIFCPIAVPLNQRPDWREKVRRNELKQWISFEKWIEFDAFLTNGASARLTYVRWIKSTLLEATKKYPELVSAHQLFSRLPDN